MKVELSKDEVSFLIRTLVMNYAENEEDFDPSNIACSNERSPIGKLLFTSQAEYSKAKSERHLEERLPPRKLFLGSGWHSIVHVNRLHKRLQFAVSELGGNQQ